MIAPIDVTDIRIETERLILRPWRKSDLEDFFFYASVPGVGEMAGWKHHTSMDDSKAILDMFLRDKKTLAFEVKENGKVIGSLGLEEPDPDPEGNEKLGREIGYVLGKDYWGRGLMPEAVNAVIRYCFDVLDYDYLTCCHFIRNEQSRRVIEKSGFRFVKDILHTTRYETVEETKLYIRYNDRRKENE